MQFRLGFVTFISIICYCSCQPKPEKIVLVDPEETVLQEINDSILSLAADTSINLIQGTAATGDTWESWENALFACFKDKTFRKKIVYLGPSNLKYLGTILSKDKTLTRRELTYIVPPTELSKFITVGTPVDNCDLTKIKDMSLNFFLSAAINQMSDSLGTAITKYDSVKVTGGKWQIDEIRTDDLIDYLNENATNPKIAGYKKSLLDKNNVVITKVVKITGFSAEVYTNKALSTAVKAELDPSKVLNIANPDSANNQLSFKLNLSSNSKSVVKVSSTGQFYIFGSVLKGTKLD
ncbi:hypothetical protein [[Flexibacter] sp. ATCC 35208]|uniref:hypothetical protein n=1 Tax=[Flexibacter] sp. ATCC 35208 TaxID=1936242 RepID=UPI0011806C31|nr:hypothetical protein [[Flexibacter] sp. ATCC 35208]